jgi:putative membrane protein
MTASSHSVKLGVRQWPIRWLLLVTLVASVWSASGTTSLDVWGFEIGPGIVGVAGLAVIARRFRFSPLAYVVISAAFVLVATGARYSYAEMPLFNWLRDALRLSRNHFDRVGHFAQGLTVCLMAREVIFRTTNVGNGWGLAILSTSVALAFSGLWELVEWWTVLAFYRESGPEWLGLQGDPWDAQWDMSMALCGALVVNTLLARWHDRSIRQMA